MALRTNGACDSCWRAIVGAAVSSFLGESAVPSRGVARGLRCFGTKGLLVALSFPWICELGVPFLRSDW